MHSGDLFNLALELLASHSAGFSQALSAFFRGELGHLGQLPDSSANHQRAHLPGKTHDALLDGPVIKGHNMLLGLCTGGKDESRHCFMTLLCWELLRESFQFSPKEESNLC